jgi:RimJ/RimL family protein N-acetyltransferase
MGIELETPRLRLRHHRREDFADCVALWADPRVVRYIGGQPSSEEEVWARILRYAGHWAWLGYGFWIIHEKSTGAHVGEAGFADFHRALPISLGDAPEIGYVLAPAHHGKGYGTEIAQAICAWADTRFEDPRTACLIHPENVASIRVATKCGFAEFARTTYKDAPAVLLERFRP